MESYLKKLLSLFLKPNKPQDNVLEEEKTDKNVLVVNQDSDLYALVSQKLNESDGHALIAKKVQDLEKSIYVLSGRLNQLSEAIERHTEFIVHLSTAYEEVANSFEQESKEGTSREQKKKSAGDDLDVYIAGKSKGKTEMN